MLAACSINSQISDQSGSIKTLKMNLGDTFKKKIDSNYVELSYCPDNTCLVFGGPLENESELADFSLLYLFHASSYVYLIRNVHGKGIFINNARNEAESLLVKYNDSCDGDELDIISCSLENLYEYGNLIAYNIRFDENDVHKNPVDIKENIGRNNLISIRTYRERYIR